MRRSTETAATRLFQIAYLSASFYARNNLTGSASACTLGFVFSFVPILMMILTLLIGILHASPAVPESLSALAGQLQGVFDMERFVGSLLETRTLTWVNFVLALFIVWMARKFFLSVVRGLSRIFRTVSPRRPLFNQLLTFAGELFLLVVCAAVLFLTNLLRQIFALPFFSSLASLFPAVFGTLSALLVNLVLYAILFVFSAAAYKFGTGSRPPLRLCVICAALCTGCFAVCVQAVSAFLDRATYNLIYGVLSNLIIVLLQVHLFFILFLLFAQAVFVVQFFDTLLLGELYLLPPRDDTRPEDSFRRILFLKPSPFASGEDVTDLSAGGTVYAAGDTADAVYYVVSGAVSESRGDALVYYGQGSFFGEIEYMLGRRRAGTVRADTDCRIMRIDGGTFSALLEKNPQAAVKAMSKLSPRGGAPRAESSRFPHGGAR